ncbi:MAG: pyridoxamine 5'-phosphate oxidase family protein [Dehalococcoidia bacterium]|tara:strand:- start:32 stop:697 length:666 start_codon:yes stop_codon:yes gene_type:complete
MNDDNLRKTRKTRVIRNPSRGIYDRETAYEIIDSTPMCHVSYTIDSQPYITPTFQWRKENWIYWHGSSASRFLKSAESTPVAINIFQFDGLVLARSGLHHSANYRSVTLFGIAELISDSRKEEALKDFVDNLIPGRWETLRPVKPQEIRATMILGMPIDEGSVKVRSGAPVDDAEDYDLPIWAGVIPFRTSIGEAVPDSVLPSHIDVPDHIKGFRLGRKID